MDNLENLSDSELDTLLAEKKAKESGLESLSDSELDLLLDKKAQDAPSTAEAFGRGLVQGVSLDWGDEAIAAGRSLVTPVSYEQAVSEERAKFKAAEEAHPGASLTGNLVGNAAAMFIPGIGEVKILKGLQGAVVMGAAAGAGKAETLKDVPKAVAIGVITNVILHKALSGAGAGVRKLSRGEAAEEILGKPMLKESLEAAQPSEFPGIEAVQAAAKAVGGAKVTDPAVLRAGEVAQRFLNAVKKVSGNEEGAGLNPEALQDIWDVTSFSQTVNESASKIVTSISPEAQAVEKLADGKITKLILSTKRFMDTIDNAMGTDLGSVVSDIHAAINNTKSEVAERLLEYKGILEKTPALKSLQEKIAWVRSAEEEGNTLTALFEKERDLLNKNKGYDISKAADTAHYLPRVLADKITIYKQISEAMKIPELKDEVTKALISLHPEARDIAALNPKRVLEGWFNSANTGSQTLQKASGRLLQRNMETPILLRELNPNKLAVQYLNNTYRSANLRTPLLKLGDRAQLLKSKGLSSAAEFVSSYGKSLSSELGLGSKLWESSAGAYKKFIVDSLEGGAARDALEKIPDFMEWLGGQFQPAVIGSNPATFFRNLTQPLMMTAPEIGGTYGAKTVMAAYKDTAKRFLTGSWKAAVEDLDRIGFHTKNKMFEAGEHADPFTENFAKQGVDKVNAGLMWLQGFSDDINRVVTQKMAGSFVDDLAAKVPGAVAQWKKVPESIRGQVEFLLESKNVQEAKDVLAKHLISKTQFIYGKEGRNQLSRALGPTLSMFTKWPTEIASDMILEPKNMSLALKHLGPLAAMLALDQGFKKSGAYDTLPGKVFLGKGVLGNAPITSLTGAGAPPLVSLLALGQTAIAEASRGSPKLPQTGAELAKRARNYVPLVGPIANAYDRFVKPKP